VRKCRAVRVPQPVPPGYYFEISTSCQVNLGYTGAKLLFGATCLLQLQRQFLAFTLVPLPVELQNSRFGCVCSAPTRPIVISALK
jgi:hypothetical protein